MVSGHICKELSGWIIEARVLRPLLWAASSPGTIPRQESLGYIGKPESVKRTRKQVCKQHSSRSLPCILPWVPVPASLTDWLSLSQINSSPLKLLGCFGHGVCHSKRRCTHVIFRPDIQCINYVWNAKLCNINNSSHLSTAMNYQIIHNIRFRNTN